MPNPNPLRLAILTQLRENARPRISQATMAEVCGLSGRTSRLTVGEWERGTAIPHANRRPRLLGYLWDTLQLRCNPQQFEEVWQVLVEEWMWEPISDREWQRLTHTPRPTATPATPTPPVDIPFQAPALTPHFVGREAEFTQLATRLLDPAPPRIVALVGMGGIGKTTLAIRLAHGLRNGFADGILWANAAESSPMDILQSWALAFGCDFSTQSSLESRAAALRVVLDHKAVLLVIDDVRSPERVRALLPNHESAVVLLTTRDLDIALALSATELQLNVLKPTHSLHLLTALVGEARITSAVTDAQQIAETVQHHPLALEIIGKLLVRNANQPLALLAKRLQDETHRLDQLQFKDLSVRASFEVSWALLDDFGRRTFALLALFEGRSFDGAAFGALLALDSGAAEEALLLMTTLSLLQETTSRRYQQHALLATFAGERLIDQTTMRRRLAEHYMSFCQQPGEQSTKIDIDFENIMAAIRFMVQDEAWPLVLALTAALDQHWFPLGRYSQARQALRWATQAAEAVADQEKLVWALRRWGEAALEQDEYAEADTLLQKALLHAQELEEDLLVADVHLLLGRLLVERSQLAQAATHLTLSYQLYKGAKQQRGEAMALYFQALAAYYAGNESTAFTHCVAAQALQEAIGDHTGLIVTLRLLTNIAVGQQQLEQADALCQQALTLAQHQQNYSENAACLYLLSMIARLQGQIDLCQNLAGQAFTKFEQMGDLAFTAAALYELGQSYKATQQFELAEKTTRRSLELLRRVESYPNTVPVLHLLGEINWATDQKSAALAHWQEAVDLGARFSHPWTAEVQKAIAAATATAPSHMP